MLIGDVFLAIGILCLAIVNIMQAWSIRGLEEKVRKLEGKKMRLIDADALIKRLQDEAAMIMSEDNFGKDRQRLARGVLMAADIVMEMEDDDD